MTPPEAPVEAPRGPVATLVRACLEHRPVVAVLGLVALAWGVLVAPFGWELPGVPRDPVAVDAIPYLGENQQVVVAEWPGRSPQDVDDQVTHPLTVALLGVPGVTDVRSHTVLGLSTIYVVFDERSDFHDSRVRILERLASLPDGTLPAGVGPALGPDATALGQVFWYTLEGRDRAGQPAGGWDLDELRTVQDFVVKTRLAAVDGVAEVASIGGHVREYQIDIDPGAMRVADVSLAEVVRAVRRGNLDVGARTVEINRVEYVVRGLGAVSDPEDLAQTVVAFRDGRPITMGDVGTVALGPAQRRGALTKGGAEAVGGVVVVRHGENPMGALRRLHERIDAIADTLPVRTLEDGRESRITIVPFYDRGALIEETLGTLGRAIEQQIYVTALVVLLSVLHLRGALIVGSMLPASVLLTFAGMKLFGVEANVVALSGIAIAIGTVVDMGIVLVDDVLQRMADAPGRDRLALVQESASEVGGAVLTAVLTTVVGFLPVFAMEGIEGRLFQPLAYTKTFALLAAILVTLTLLPVAMYAMLRLSARRVSRPLRALQVAVIVLGTLQAARVWEPLGPGRSLAAQVAFLVLVGGAILVALRAVQAAFPRLLRAALERKPVVLVPALAIVAFGGLGWLGIGPITSRAPDLLRETAGVRALEEAFPGLGREFMPDLDEGAFLYMPTTMPHASIGEVVDMMRDLDRAILSVPEVETAVSKCGRVESALDPAPLSMIETIVQYRSEYETDASGRILEDSMGRPVRQWREHIASPEDIWEEIARVARIPGLTLAPKLQPIEARVVMLQSGVRAPMAIRVQGPDLPTIERFGLELESVLERVPSVAPASVFADRVVGKPYLEIEVDRGEIARHGLAMADVQEVIEVAIGGKPLTSTIEGRERYAVRVRYPRELRGSPEALGDVLVATPAGAQVPLRELARVVYRRGPQAIRSEDTFLVSFVLFDKRPGETEVEVVEEANRQVHAAIEAGDLTVPTGVTFEFTGAYENQVRATERLRIVLPLALTLIYVLLYLRFRSTVITAIVFSGVFVAWGGGFAMLWLYGQSWFLDVTLLGVNLRELFHVQPIHLSVAVWVGFLALFGIATDDGVIMAARIRSTLEELQPRSLAGVRNAVTAGARRRIRAAVMTTSSTVLALLPVLTSSGRGAEVMIPMAIPTMGGMAAASITWFVVPVLYCRYLERTLVRRSGS